MVLNGKGGVLKTSLTANLAGLAAASGWRTLVVDLDPQGDLGRDLGYMEDSDGGASLYQAAFGLGELELLREVRPRLDVIAGGPHTRRFADQTSADVSSHGGSPEPLGRLDDLLGPLAGDYDLIVLDLPPSITVLHSLAALAAHYIIVPTTGDRSSNDGLGEVFGQLLEARSAQNPDLEVLGVVVTLVPTGATAIARDILDDLNDMLKGKVRIFNTTIRIAKAAALAYRERGLLAYEYELEASKAPKWYEAMRLGRRAERYSSASSGLAEDYQRLADEVLAAFSERQSEYLARVG